MRATLILRLFLAAVSFAIAVTGLTTHDNRWSFTAIALGIPLIVSSVREIRGP